MTDLPTLTLYDIIPTFKDPCKRKPLKTLWEKEKMLVTSIFSFSHNVYYSFHNKIKFLSQIFLSSAHAFSLELSRILPFGLNYLLLLTNMKVPNKCIAKVHTAPRGFKPVRKRSSSAI